MRRTLIVGIGIALAMTLLGCAPEAPLADPAPSFASDEEAFAAAEATYRAYVDALNDVDLSDPETFEGVYAWTTGEANAGERETLSQMHADRWTVKGETVVVGFHGTAAKISAAPATVSAVVCSDVSEVAVVDESGESVVGANRPNLYALDVQFLLEGEALRISESKAIVDDRCE